MDLAGIDPHLLRRSLLGCAVGDSLGAEIELWSLEQIRSDFLCGFTDLPPHDGILGAIGDDAQMTFFTAEGIWDAYERGTFRDIRQPFCRLLVGTVNKSLMHFGPIDTDAGGVVG